jgi:hypothetical protein
MMGKVFRPLKKLCLVAFSLTLYSAAVLQSKKNLSIVALLGEFVP